jgi:hypothetical protein
MPIYTHHRDIGTSKWVSTVTIVNGDGESCEIVGTGCNRKTHADIAAATEVITMLGIIDAAGSGTEPVVDVSVLKCAHTFQDYYDSITGPGIYVLIDYENVNKLQHLHHVYRRDDGVAANIFKFIGYSHHKVETDEASHIVHSGGSDAVDHAISMFVGIVLAKLRENEGTLLVVLTRDQFAERLQNMLQSSSPDQECIHLPTEEQCVELLLQMGYKRTQERISYRNRARRALRAPQPLQEKI